MSKLSPLPAYAWDGSCLEISETINAVKSARNYSTINVSQLDDQVAGYGLSEAVRLNLLDKNIELARTDLEFLDAFVKKHQSVCFWVKPTAGTTINCVHA
ncbi:aspartate aminotransferase [Colletotrichum orchidophilum]|uniref:Aspartate aminotransferase n=1 Tax=Colletotrichum orchidophilum TaxID=1209926 RepID=A0A1G4AUZ4_9PEZI|nr:aspartate aminotransferase [Colletotrichum orchidophilum]OHE92987.1 aspartate aminotransferase [Colletotrichum orchidophilum]